MAATRVAEQRGDTCAPACLVHGERIPEARKGEVSWRLERNGGLVWVHAGACVGGGSGGGAGTEGLDL
jgi:hypothetical protein